MKIVTRYLGGIVVKYTLLILLILINLSAIIVLIEQLSQIGKGDYNSWYAGLYTILMIPFHVKLLLPMASLLGVLVALGRMVINKELIVMQAIGYSRWQIVLCIINYIVPLLTLSLILNLWIAPLSSKYASTLRTQALFKKALLIEQEQLWIKNKDAIIYIQRVLNEHKLQGVTIFELNNDHKLDAIVYSEYANFCRDHWQLEQITKRILDKNDLVRVEKSSSTKYALALTPKQLGVLVTSPQECTIFELYDYINYLHNTDQDCRQHKLIFWRNLLEPLVMLTITVLATLSIFIWPVSVSIAKRVTWGIIGCFTFYVIGELIGHLSIVYNISAFFGASMPFICYLLISTILLIMLK